MARILVVEDDFQDYFLLYSVLNGEGHKTYHVSDGEKDLSTYRKRDIDVVVRVEDAAGRTYELHVMVLDEEDRKALGRFIVPSSGYPISLGHTDEDGSFTVSKLDGSQDLIDYFLAMMEPDSTVMKFLSYRLRNAPPGSTPPGTV